MKTHRFTVRVVTGIRRGLPEVYVTSEIPGKPKDQLISLPSGLEITDYELNEAISCLIYDYLKKIELDAQFEILD